jgi:hypothetical protein
MKDTSTDNICQLPISSVANEANDSGVPLSLARPDAAAKELLALGQLAQIVSKELFCLPYRSDGVQEHVTFEGNVEQFKLSTIRLSKNDDSLLVRAFSESGAMQQRITPEELKNRDPKTGKELERSDDELDSNDKGGSMVTLHQAGSGKSHKKIVPDRIEKKAKVGYEVTWSDGAKFIYSRRAIALAAGGVFVK